MEFVIVAVAIYLGDFLEAYVFETPVFDSPAKCQEAELNSAPALGLWTIKHILEYYPDLEDGLEVSFGCQPKPPAPGQGV